MCRSNLLGVGPDAAAALFPPNPKSTSQRSLSRPLPLRKTITTSDISALAHQLAPNQRAPGDQPPVCGIAAGRRLNGDEFRPNLRPGAIGMLKVKLYRHD